MSRRTVARRAGLEGTGLHTGAPSRVEVAPADPGSGIRFRRVDHDPPMEIPARFDRVVATERRTVLGALGVSIETVEHLMAAVTAAELDDLVIDVYGPEIPIMDGSFEPFSALLEEAGWDVRPGEPMVYTVAEEIVVTDGQARYQVMPGDHFRLSVSIVWDHPLIGAQDLELAVNWERFLEGIAGARTFGFTSEVAALRARGLLKGGSLQNALVLDESALIEGELRYVDEFVRHKMGDILGDLGLLGGRLRAHIIATRPSHSGNLALARTLARCARLTGGNAMDVTQITAVLPHRFPFLLVDRIISVEKDRIVGIKNVSINEPFFQGHFPDHPIMPGVLIVEAMAQVGGMLLMDMVENPQSKVVYFMALDDVRFRRPVVPGDQLRSEVTVLQNRGKTCKMRGEAYVDGHLVCEATMLARVVDR